jgi:hypothetical protein
VTHGFSILLDVAIEKKKLSGLEERQQPQSNSSVLVALGNA